mmetsp:Transcript_29849/g.63316  ORF Transcript_29849/g.63316 Transcript_29849/m.63316 type:complete len:85 (+) Transcript_29849:1091-1345(+)
MATIKAHPQEQHQQHIGKSNITSGNINGNNNRPPSTHSFVQIAFHQRAAVLSTFANKRSQWQLSKCYMSLWVINSLNFVLPSLS